MMGGVLGDSCDHTLYPVTMTRLKDYPLASVIVVALVISVVGVVSYTTTFAAFFGSGGQDLQELVKDPLGAALQVASFKPNRTVILAVLNRAYTNRSGMLDLFLESMREGEGTAGLVEHVLFVAVDNKAYRTCKDRYRGLHCYKLTTPGSDFSKEEIYMSKFFNKMMWRRTKFLGEVLRRGYNFVFTDMDVMWLRNPFPLLLSHDEDDDLQFSVDTYIGDPYSERNPLNTGFYYAKANNKTVALFNAWYGHHNDSGGEKKKDQDVLGEMKNNGTFNDLGLKVRYLDTKQISGFCGNSRGFNETMTVHANCCRSVKAKLKDLMVVMREWSSYRRDGVVSGFQWPKMKTCRQSWMIKMHFGT